MNENIDGVGKNHIQKIDKKLTESTGIVYNFYNIDKINRKWTRITFNRQ